MPHSHIHRSLDLVFVSSSEGHRKHYAHFLANQLGLTALCAPLGLIIIYRLIKCRQLLLATIDDHILVFSLILLCRSLLGKRSVVLFLSPQRCFLTVRFKYRVRRWLFMALKCLPRTMILTILPFTVDQRYAEVAHAGVADPQLWDLLTESQGQEADTSPAPCLDWISQLRQKAAGRKIVTLPGTLSALKGFDYYTQLVVHDPTLLEKYMFVAAGKVSPDMRSFAELFMQSGCHLTDRVLSDAEIEYLYKHSDFIWACYSPDYDQASGIFGRALQYNIPVFVREGSLVHFLAASIDAPAIGIRFGDVQACASQLHEACFNISLSGSTYMAVLQTWKDDFLSTVLSGLQGGRRS